MRIDVVLLGGMLTLGATAGCAGRSNKVTMELLRQEATTMRRPGGNIDVVRFALRPTVNWLVDPVIRMLTPETNFFVQPGAPPGLARFEGPRNFVGQKIRIE